LTRPISPHMKNFLKKIVQHKIISGLLLIGLVLLGLWKFGVFTKKEETRYVLAAVENGTIISSISGTGQISSLDEVSVKSKASGDVIYVGVESGDEVGVGRTLVMVDTTDAEKAIEDAKENLEDAQAELEKMKGITTEVGSIRGIKEKAQADLDKAYEDGFNNVSNTYLGLPDRKSVV
jgi:multidrug efflux pump subunit AcrA (membrane-fusion protein)